MYETNCEYCTKKMWAYAKNKRGDLPKVFCSKACEANYKYQKRIKVDYDK